MQGFLIAVISAVFFHSLGADSVVVPSTSCYALDNSSRIHDFLRQKLADIGDMILTSYSLMFQEFSFISFDQSDLIGQVFEYDDDKDPDLVVRFCKDVETRSRMGYVDFGRFDNFNHFIASSGYVNFVQEYYGGDLLNCEKSFDKLGRTAQVNIICGNCPNGQCVGGLGCICNVTRESACRVLVDLAIPCVKPGLRVFEGCTVGFHPRSWEIVYNGMTQLGYEKAYNEFSFKTEHRHVTLYMTAVASFSGLVQKPTIKIYPDQGLQVRLSGSGANAIPPTTLSPTLMLLEWRCERAHDSPYEVEITIPIENYDPIQFTFAKMCEQRQKDDGEATRGWAIFGILSCVFIVVFTLFCCGGFIYRTRVENMRGLDALPGMATLSACLETVTTGVGQGYTRPADARNPFVNETSWEEQQQGTSTEGTWRQSERTYGSI